MAAVQTQGYGSKGGLKNEIGAIFRPSTKRNMLWMTTFAFFMTFVIWFNVAPFLLAIAKSTGLTSTEMAALLLCNLVLAVPGRVLAGRLLDRYGPRKLYGWLLIVIAIPNSAFAFSHTFTQLAISRLALGLVGSGFVIGIRLVAEWYRGEGIGIAEGFYGGWGNSGSAAAALLLPALSTLIAHGPQAWRWAIFASGIAGALYGAAFLHVAKNSPDGMFQKARSASSLEVTSRAGLLGLVALQVPLVAILALVTARLQHGGVFSPTGALLTYTFLAALLIYQTFSAIHLNRHVIKGVPSPRAEYHFSSVFLLSLAYAVTFGTELTMVSLLPTYFATTFGLKVAVAGVAGSAFAFTNFLTRPLGGIISDLSRSRSKTLSLFLVGSALTFLLLSQLSRSWPLFADIGAIAVASIFIQGGNGANFAMVPGIRKDITGQIAGLVGAYGNLGGLALSSLLYYTSTKESVGDIHLAFVAIATSALIVAIACQIFLNRDLAVAQLPAPRALTLEQA